MARKEMVKIVSDAKKRRAEILKEYTNAKALNPDLTLRKFAKRYKLTGERIGQHLKKALEDINGSR
jgi:DNA-directed RNA polymerase sigma subunit (sigma70/sigma32)